MTLKEFFDRAYSEADRYWWKEDSRYDTEPDHHPTSLVTRTVLRLVQSMTPGRALDIGGGEGSDAIRLAKLGWEVDVVELSSVAVEKVRRFAREVGVPLRVCESDALAFEPQHPYEAIICNGVLHYVKDKATLIEKMQNSTEPGGFNAVSLWSNYSEVPEEHRVVPCFPDDEDGVTAGMYRTWDRPLLYFERLKGETAHSDLGAHAHSFIKIVAVKPGSSD